MTLSPRITPTDRGQLAAAGILTVSHLFRTIAAQAVTEAERRQAQADLAAQIGHPGPIDRHRRD